MTPEEKRASLQALRERIGRIMVSKTPRKGFTAKQRKAVLAAYDGRCAGCDDELQPGFHIDHVKPLADGGAHEPRNWVPICVDCHQLKTAREATARAKTERIRKREVEGPQPSRIRSAGFRQDITKRMDGTVVRRKPA